ncbi:protein phosphatase 1 regulatory subunit 36-like [Musca vetustissima]|uniref:protein phosphatase 1 regulatory subunit 36-like n=1 Tax=Musca vetustissima TaxID=27455 RepID=UPI002AB7BADA|nr:protein phosphatase 1 regulatory subunit 36-like [Musca vetustissima]
MGPKPELCFEPKHILAKRNSGEINEEYIIVGGHKFKRTMDQVEAMIFRQEFERPDNTHDADVILVQDIKNLVLFLAPTQMTTKPFVSFLNTESVHSLLKALIIYFEYFLKVLQFILIRREEMMGEKARMQNQDSIEIKRIFSANISQHRLLLAREYSRILLGNGDMKKFYHMKPVVNISLSTKDQQFHESFLAFCTVLVWIATERRSLTVINWEIDRLFRSEHFALVHCNLGLSNVEARLLYGKHYKRCNYRAQSSPLIQELANVESQNLPLLWVGERKYRGYDIRIAEIELEYIVPSSQLCLIDVSHGILGRPKKLYDTMLHIKWEAVHKENYNEHYDPYRIIRQTYLNIPQMDAEKRRKYCQTYESYYQLKYFNELWPKNMIEKWIKRNSVIGYFKTDGMLTDIRMKCNKELENNSYGRTVEEIIEDFLSRKEKLRKK